MISFFSCVDIELIFEIFDIAGNFGAIYSLVCKKWFVLIERYNNTHSKFRRIDRNVFSLLKRRMVKLYYDVHPCLPPIKLGWLLGDIRSNYAPLPKQDLESFLTLEKLEYDRFVSFIKDKDEKSLGWLSMSGYVPQSIEEDVIITSIRGKSVYITAILFNLLNDISTRLVEEIVKTDDIDFIFTLTSRSVKLWRQAGCYFPFIVRHFSFENLEKVLHYRNQGYKTQLENNNGIVIYTAHWWFNPKMDEDVAVQSIIEAIKRKDDKIIDIVRCMTNGRLPCSINDLLLSGSRDSDLYRLKYEESLIGI